MQSAAACGLRQPLGLRARAVPDSWRRRNGRSGADQGAPEQYAVYPEQMADTQLAITSVSADPSFDKEDPIFGSLFTTKGIVFDKPSDSTYSITVYGRFFSKTMDTGSDETFWSMRHPDLLVMAACYMLEVFYRNTEGQKDWLFAMRDLLQGIDSDLVDQETADINEMEG